MDRIPDKLWNQISWIFEKQKGRGRPASDARKTLAGVFFILETGAQWRRLPREYGAKSTVHGCFMRWVNNGTFKLFLDYSRVLYFEFFGNCGWFAIDAMHSKAPLALFSGKSPVDRRKRGVKRTIIVDWHGAAIAIVVGPGNRHDSYYFENAFSQLPQAKSLQILAADSAYDDTKIYTRCWQKNFALHAATNPRRRKNIRKIKPMHRWKVEQTHGHFAWMRGLKLCWTKLQKSFQALNEFYAAITLFKRLGFSG